MPSQNSIASATAAPSIMATLTVDSGTDVREAEFYQGEGGNAIGGFNEVEADVPIAPTSESVYDAVAVEGINDKGAGEVENVDIRDVDIRARENAATRIQVYATVHTLPVVSFSRAVYRLLGYSRTGLAHR